MRLVVRALALASLTFLALAGCSSPDDPTVISVVESQPVTAAQGPQVATGRCGEDADLSLSMGHEAGSLRVTVLDAEDRVVYDSGSITQDGPVSSRAASMAGEPGVWTLTVHRTTFSGSYAVQVVC